MRRPSTYSSWMARASKRKVPASDVPQPTSVPLTERQKKFADALANVFLHRWKRIEDEEADRDAADAKLKVPQQSRTILRKPAVIAKTGLSSTTIWRLMRGNKFPRSVQLTEHTVGWFADEIEAWLDSRSITTTASFPHAEHARRKRHQ